MDRSTMGLMDELSWEDLELSIKLFEAYEQQMKPKNTASNMQSLSNAFSRSFPSQEDSSWSVVSSIAVTPMASPVSSSSSLQDPQACLARELRAQALQRHRQKKAARAERANQKLVKYIRRSVIASNRPRIHGRFLKKDEMFDLHMGL